MTQVFLGNGCYWEVQYDIVKFFEQDVLGRGPDQITGVAGYVGGTGVSPDGHVCFDNNPATDSYYRFGHAEAVRFVVDSPTDFALGLGVYFAETFQNETSDDGSWQRKDIYDQGRGMRAVIGVPGGLEGEWGRTVVDVNQEAHNMTLRTGLGNDGDTFLDNSIYVYDTDAFVFHQAEICLQFHDNVTATYPIEYHDLQSHLVRNGRLTPTGCPKSYLCTNDKALDPSR